MWETMAQPLGSCSLHTAQKLKPAKVTAKPSMNALCHKQPAKATACKGLGQGMHSRLYSPKLAKPEINFPWATTQPSTKLLLAGKEQKTKSLYWLPIFWLEKAKSLYWLQPAQARTKAHKAASTS